MRTTGQQTQNNYIDGDGDGNDKEDDYQSNDYDDGCSVNEGCSEKGGCRGSDDE